MLRGVWVYALVPPSIQDTQSREVAKNLMPSRRVCVEPPLRLLRLPNPFYMGNILACF